MGMMAYQSIVGLPFAALGMLCLGEFGIVQSTELWEDSVRFLQRTSSSHHLHAPKYIADFHTTTASVGAIDQGFIVWFVLATIMGVVVTIALLRCNSVTSPLACSVTGAAKDVFASLLSTSVEWLSSPSASQVVVLSPFFPLWHRCGTVCRLCSDPYHDGWIGHLLWWKPGLLYRCLLRPFPLLARQCPRAS